MLHGDEHVLNEYGVIVINAGQLGEAALLVILLLWVVAVELAVTTITLLLLVLLTLK